MPAASKTNVPGSGTASGDANDRLPPNVVVPVWPVAKTDIAPVLSVVVSLH